MQQLINSISPYIYKGILAPCLKQGLSVKECIDQIPTFTLANFNHTSKTKYQFEFYSSDIDKLNDALAFDLNRMAIASFESIYALQFPENEYPKSSAWIVIKSYYSAFFAAHTILRIFGSAAIQIESSQKTKLISSFQYSSQQPLPNEQIKSGLHIFNLSNSQANHFSIKILPNGTHEDTWKAFSNLLTELDQKLLTNSSIPTIVRNEASRQISDLKTILSTDGHSENWLSFVRNEVNYKHSFGTWFPHKTSNTYRDEILLYTKEWYKFQNLSLTKKQSSMSRFIQGAIFIVNLAKNLLIQVESYSQGESYLKKGALKVLSVSKVR